MNKKQPIHHDEKTRQVGAELEGVITRHYPSATFSLRRGSDAPSSINILATVAVDDPDDVLEKVLDRVVELNVDEGIPVHVIPLRTLERIAAYRRRARPRRMTPL